MGCGGCGCDSVVVLFWRAGCGWRVVGGGWCGVLRGLGRQRREPFCMPAVLQIDQMIHRPCEQAMFFVGHRRQRSFTKLTNVFL